MAPTATTISTNPPGMEIIVDGERIATPATLDWSPGSKHVLEALSPQTVGGKRFRVRALEMTKASGLRTVDSRSRKHLIRSELYRAAEAASLLRPG